MEYTKGIRQFFATAAALCPLLSVRAAPAAPPAQVFGAWTYAFAEYGDIRYPEAFAHYDFVNPKAPKGGTLKLANPGARSSFDKYNPFTLPQIAPAGVEQFVFETLTDASLDEPATMYGLIAEQMLVAPDFSAISFRINPLAHFTNGDPVTAADVKYSFERAVSPASAPPYSHYFDDIKEAIVVDPQTIRFELKQPSRDQIFLVGTQLRVFSPKWGRSPNGTTKPFELIVHEEPIATGPYLIAKGTGQTLDLIRDPNYWARNLGVRRGFYNFDHLIYHYYSDDAARLEGFKAGDFDLLDELIAKRFVRLFVGPKFRDGEIIKKRLPVSMGFLYEGFILNARRPEFSDPRVRDALNYAFDWTWSLSQAYGLGLRFSGLFENSIYGASGLPGPGELALLEPYRQDLPREVFAVPQPNPVSDTPAALRANLLHARKLLAEAGWTIQPDGLLRNAKGAPFQIEMLESNLDFDAYIGRWAENLKKLGITTRSRLVDFAVYQNRLDAFDFDCTFISYGDIQLPSASNLQSEFGTVAARTQGSDNLWGIANPAIDHVLDFIARANSMDELATGTRALDRLFIAGHYAIPFMYRPYNFVSYWDKFGIPATTPKYYSVVDGLAAPAWPVSTWWAKAAH
jgi:microcin C transport system substrate-binding protein